MKTKISISVLSLISFLSGCKIAGSKRPVESTSSTTVMSYFVAEQYKIETPGYPTGANLSDAMSSLYGIAFVADSEASFSNFTQPSFGCEFSSGVGLLFQPKRAVDIGSFRLSGFGLNEVEVPKDQENVSQSIYGTLSEGSYTLKNQGINGNLAFAQEFVVPKAGEQIKVLSGNQPVQALSTPILPSVDDPYYTVTVFKTQALTLEFKAPPTAQYVRVRISDGTAKQEGTITCYGPADSPLTIPRGAMNFFRSTEDGVLNVDFINVSYKNDVNKIKESVIVSYSRHVHGLVDFFIDDVKQTAHFGVLRFE